jgi:hypothetical protein
MINQKNIIFISEAFNSSSKPTPKMVFFTTIMLYTRVADFWYKAGISPLNLQPAVETYSHENHGFDLEFKNEPSPPPPPQNTYNFFQVYSWKEAKSLFWFTFGFSIFSLVLSLVKLWVIISHADTSEETPSVIGGICWCSYILSCCFIYGTHLMVSKGICQFLQDWQTIEGEILTGMKILSKIIM